MARARDELFETLVSVCGANLAELTKSERGRFNRACKELREVKATPAEVRRRARRYAARYPHITVTPNGLVAHWSEFKQGGHMNGAVAPISRLGLSSPPPEPDIPPEEITKNFQRLREMIGSVGKEIPDA